MLFARLIIVKKSRGRASSCTRCWLLAGIPSSLGCRAANIQLKHIVDGGGCSVCSRRGIASGSDAAAGVAKA